MEGANSGNVVFPLKRSVTGNKEWDYNMDGLAHYGLMVDFLQDFYNVMKKRLGVESEKPAALISLCSGVRRIICRCGRGQ